MTSTAGHQQMSTQQRTTARSPAPSLHMVKDLMGDAMILAHCQLFKLAPAISFAIRAHRDAGDAVVVLGQPILTAAQAFGFDLIQWVLMLLSRLQVRGMVLRKVQKELWAVGVTHGHRSSQDPHSYVQVLEKWL
eukprot:CAMPEP_0114647886 /NCGR_PEP_ID=MMETSP0191-20121206/6037_1 /TAXON_ID=126664 /ORGANISM="Sorites sp." /LENGTH=133 /DNA_ID=CAMNT_0001861039 /DNA_START=18 /DNA_END=415 /DNA_ORIENTATION=-